MEDHTKGLVQVYFIVASIALLLLAVTIGLVYRRIAVGRMISETETQAVAVAQRFIDTSWHKFHTFVSEAPGLSFSDLRAHPTAAEASRALETVGAGMSVIKARLCGASGLIVASTVPDEIGRYATDAAVLEMTAGSRYGSSRLGADSELVQGRGIEGAPVNVDLVVSHIVIRADEPKIAGAAWGVLSIYQDVTQGLRDTARTQALIIGGGIAAATLFLGIAWLWWRRGSD